MVVCNETDLFEFDVVSNFKYKIQFIILSLFWNVFEWNDTNSGSTVFRTIFITTKELTHPYLATTPGWTAKQYEAFQIPCVTCPFKNDWIPSSQPITRILRPLPIALHNMLLCDLTMKKMWMPYTCPVEETHSIKSNFAGFHSTDVHMTISVA